MKKVRCIDNFRFQNLLTIGKIYNVEKDTDCFYEIKTDRHISGNFSFLKERFEDVIEEKEMELNTRPKLVAGNVVELNNGKRGLVVMGNDGSLFIYWARSISESKFMSHTLLKTDDCAHYAKVYNGLSADSPSAGLSGGLIGSAYFSDSDIIWQKELPPLKLTLAEIAKKFDVEVSQLQITDYE